MYMKVITYLFETTAIFHMVTVQTSLFAFKSICVQSWEGGMSGELCLKRKLAIKRLTIIFTQK